MSAESDTPASLAPRTSLRPQPRPAGHRPPATGSVTHRATLKDALPLTRTTLIGVISRTDGSTALLREADGTVRKVTPGDRVGALNVVAIRDKTVQLDIGGLAVVLTMPS